MFENEKSTIKSSEKFSLPRSYISIDLKSFYASVECMERGLDPMKTSLVVADISRTEKTICLAVSPALKAYGIPGRPRLFEVLQKIKEVNIQRQQQAPERRLNGSSNQEDILRSNPALAVDFVIAPPQMVHYMQISSQIYEVYLKYVSPEDVHIYSIDEVFIDATSYLVSNGMTAREMAMKMILDVHKTTGITATAGIGPNLYLSKVAMDIWAKHIPADENGVRIAELDEMSYRRFLWGHRPLTDFGVLVGDMQKSWSKMDCIRWGILQDVPSVSRATFIMRSFYTVCSESMLSCSSTMRGAGSHVPLRTLRYTGRKAAV